MLISITLLLLNLIIIAHSYRISTKNWLGRWLNMNFQPNPTTPCKELVQKKDENSTGLNSASDNSLLDDSHTAFETRCTLNSAEKFSPMERVILTANGNLQRVLSAIYNAPVRVHVKKSERSHSQVFSREVDLIVQDQVVCAITGEITVHDPSCLDLVEGAGSMGVGQIFRHLHVSPAFQLLAVGRGHMGVWREYTLSSYHISCRFLEKFSL